MEEILKTNKPGVEAKTLRCVDCGTPFVFSAGEQLYFQSKGLSTPKRCPQCRQRRRDTLIKEGDTL